MRSTNIFVVCIIFLSTWAMAQSNSIPYIEQPLAPTAAQPGGAGFTLTITGAGFTSDLQHVFWEQNGTVTDLPITTSTATQITTTVPAGNIAGAGTAWVSVETEITGLFATSNVEYFQIATPAFPQFADPVDYHFGGTAESALVADFNGDGILDLAVGVMLPTGASEVCILLGISGGTFPSSPTCYPVDNASSMVEGVFIPDGGALDIVAGDTYLENNGSGVFTVKSLPTTGFVPYAVGDFSQTGELYIAGTLNGNVQILQSQGDGVFAVGQNFATSTTEFGGMLTADFNGDGILDLAVLDIYPMDPVVRVFLGAAGTAGFNTTFKETAITPALNDTVVAFTAADFNGNGNQGLAVAYNPSTGGEVLILNGNGDGTFTSGFSEALATPISGAIVAADFNEDGILDLATGTYVLLGNRGGTFQTPIGDGGDEAFLLATGDFNGDGRPDLVAQDVANTSVAVILQQITAAAPAVTLAPSTLTFSTQIVGTTSAAQPVTLTNSGSAALTITSIGFTGANASEFAQTNNCPPAPATLAAGSNCSIKVTFTPTAAGTAAASISIADNATGSPQTVPIAGTAPFLTTTCTSLTVVPGQTAIFTVDLTPINGLTPTVALSCSGAPALATCTVSPNSVTLSAATTAQVTATTTQATGFLQSPFEHSNGNRMAGLVGLVGITGFAALVVLPGKRRVKPGRRLYGLIFLLCLLATVATLPSCGGGGGGGVDPPGTAVGTYPLTVTGTFQLATGAPITETVSFNLVVK